MDWTDTSQIPKTILLTDNITIEGNKYFDIIKNILEIFNDSSKSLEKKVFLSHLVILDEINYITKKIKYFNLSLDPEFENTFNYSNQANLLLSLCLSSCMPYSGKKEIAKGWKFILRLFYDISKSYIKLGKITINKWSKDVSLSDIEKIVLSNDIVKHFYEELYIYLTEQLNQGFYLRFKTIFNSSGILLVTLAMAKWLLKAIVCIDQNETKSVQVKKVIEFIDEEISWSNTGCTVLLEGFFTRFFQMLFTNQNFVWCILNTTKI